MADFRVVSIAFVNKQTEDVYLGDIIELFRRFETIMVINSNWIYKRVRNKLMRIHAYEWPDLNEDFVVVPFGIQKEGTDKPLGINHATQRLEDIPEDMFDVNCLAYHKRYQVGLLTTNRPGPTMRDIEDYINQFFPEDFPCRIRIDPLVKDALLTRMRATREARSLEVILDLGRPLDQLFRRQIQQPQGLAAALKSIATASKDMLESRTFTLTLGLGHAQNSTMDVRAMVELLDELNLDDDAIKEIAVKFRDNQSQELAMGYAKNDKVSLTIPFQFRGRVSSEVLKVHLDDLLRANRNRYFEQIQNIFAGADLMENEYELTRQELYRPNLEFVEV